MPTYVYQCDDCGHDFEAFQKFSEDPLTVCSACGGHVRRVLQPAPVIFKGSGWYVNDSRSKESAAGPAKKDDAKAAKADDGPKAEKSEPKAEKSASKAESTAKPEKAAVAAATAD